MAKHFFAVLVLISIACLLNFTTSAESQAVANEEIEVVPTRKYMVVSATEKPTADNVAELTIPTTSLTLSDQKTIKAAAANEYPTTWCIAKPSMDEEKLQDNIDYACTRIDCAIIAEGGNCFTPNNKVSHASVVMNLYYKTFGKIPYYCDFASSGLIVVADPSVGICKYDA